MPTTIARMLRSILRAAEDMGALALEAQSHYLLAESLRVQGKAAEADRSLASARSILQEIQAESGDGPLTRTDLAPIAKAAGI